MHTPSEPVSRFSRLFPIDALVANMIKTLEPTLIAPELCLPVAQSPYTFSPPLARLRDSIYQTAATLPVYPAPAEGDLTTELRYLALPRRYLRLIGTDITREIPVFPGYDEEERIH